MPFKRGFYRIGALFERIGVLKMSPENIKHGANFTLGTSALALIYAFNSGAMADHNDYTSRVAVLESRVEIQERVIQSTLKTVKDEITTSRGDFNRKFQNLDRKIDKNQDRIIELLSSDRG